MFNNFFISIQEKRNIMSKYNFWLLILSIILFIFSLILIQSDNFYKLNFKEFSFSEIKQNPFYVIFSSMCGFKILVSDFLWMDIIQYIGDRNNAKTNYKELYPKTMNLITIDPNFTYAYLAVSGILMFELKEIDKAIELIKKGIENNPKYWQLNLYLAAYTYSKGGNIKMAVHNIEIAVIQEGHPPMLERILGNMYVKLSEIEKPYKDFWMEKAKNLWWYMYHHPLEELNKKYAEEHLKKYGFMK